MEECSDVAGTGRKVSHCGYEDWALQPLTRSGWCGLKGYPEEVWVPCGSKGEYAFGSEDIRKGRKLQLR